MISEPQNSNPSLQNSQHESPPRGASIRDPQLLRISDLRVHFRTEDGVVKAVDGVSLEIGTGETLGLVGESGCGKSVTAYSILKLLTVPPAEYAGGQIIFRGDDLMALDEKAMRSVRGN